MTIPRSAQFIIITILTLAVLVAAGVLIGLVAFNNPSPLPTGAPITPAGLSVTSVMVLSPTVPSIANALEITPLAPTKSNTNTPQPAPVVTIQTISTHTVKSGESLSLIASQNGVSLDQILAANPEIKDPNQISVGQVIIIPGREILPILTSPTVETIALQASPTIQPLSTIPIPASVPYTAIQSLITSDADILEQTYPSTAQLEGGKLIVHYQPGAFYERNLPGSQAILTDAFELVQSKLGPLNAPIDVYIAGSFFTGNENLRGLAQSGLYRTFIMLDGASNEGERRYTVAHELTHIFATHTFGLYSSAMLHEGLATYVPQEFLAQGGFLTAESMCAMFQAEDRLPSMVTLVSGSYGDQFAGHIRSFINYDSSACFIKYIKDTYGLEKLDAVYDTGDYAGVFGKDLHTLNTNWQASLAHVKQPADSSEFMRILDKVIAGYEDYFAKTPRGGHTNWNAYLAIDRARMALLSGDLAKAEGEVATYYGLMGE